MTLRTPDRPEPNEALERLWEFLLDVAMRRLTEAQPEAPQSTEYTGTRVDTPHTEGR